MSFDPNHPFSVKVPPKDIIDRIEEMRAMVRKDAEPECPVHGGKYPMCKYYCERYREVSPETKEVGTDKVRKNPTTVNKISSVINVLDGYNTVCVGKYTYSGVFKNNTMLFGIMCDGERAHVCRVTPDCRVDSDLMKVTTREPFDIHYYNFCFIAEGKYELWCDIDKTTAGENKSTDTIYVEKTSTDVRIWCNTSESKMILFNNHTHEFDDTMYVLCGVPIYDEKGRAIAISGRGWTQMPDMSGNMPECRCPEIGACRCLNAYRERNDISIWGDFNAKGQPSGVVHIEHRRKYDFVGEYLDGKWEGQGHLVLRERNQIWTGEIRQGTFKGTIIFKNFSTGAVISVFVGSCHVDDNLHISALSGEYLTFDQMSRGINTPARYFRGDTVTLGRYGDTDRVSGKDSVMYMCEDQILARGFEHGVKKLQGYIERDAFLKYTKARNIAYEEAKSTNRSMAQIIQSKCTVILSHKEGPETSTNFSGMQTCEYDPTVDMVKVSLGYTCDDTFIVDLPYFPDYRGQVEISLDQGQVWQGFFAWKGKLIKNWRNVQSSASVIYGFGKPFMEKYSMDD